MKRKKKKKIDWSTVPEEWRPVAGWPYEVSSHGRVRRAGPRGRGARPGHILSGKKHPAGYLKVSLSRGDAEAQFYIHTLVLAAFVGPCPDGWETNHDDGVKSNNVLWNLEYTTPQGNSIHAVKTGLHKYPALTTHCRKGHLKTQVARRGNTLTGPREYLRCAVCRSEQRRKK